MSRSAGTPARVASVFTHRRTEETGPAIRSLIEVARRAGAVLRFDEEETQKHGLKAAEGVEVDAAGDGADVCFALGGDGTILTALRRYAGTGVPVFGINFGEIGFLATAERDHDGGRESFERGLAGDFDVMTLPGLELVELADSGEPAGAAGAGSPQRGRRWIAINDIAIHRKPGNRVADLSYSVGGDEVGRVRCDGLVVASPAGSTGYNLANGGPIMAWGVEGYAVSFIAPHSLTARSLVVAPGDSLSVHNRSREEPVDATVDGRPATEIAAHGSFSVSFARDCGARLAQLPGATFYGRLREKFGRLATLP